MSKKKTCAAAADVAQRAPPAAIADSALRNPRLLDEYSGEDLREIVWCAIVKHFAPRKRVSKKAAAVKDSPSIDADETVAPGDDDE